MIISTLLLALRVSHVSAEGPSSCLAFGVDYQDGGNYVLEAGACFTALQYFSGCEDDKAQNFLIDPSGNEQRCSQTPMKPDGAIQQIDCAGVEMSTGAWSLLVMSYNGGAGPVIFQRDFYLFVGHISSNVVISTYWIAIYSMHAVAVTNTAASSEPLDHYHIGTPSDLTTTAVATIEAPKSHSPPSTAVVTVEAQKAISLPSRSAEMTKAYTTVITSIASSVILKPSTLSPPPRMNQIGPFSPSASGSSAYTTSLGRFTKQLAMGWRPSNYWRHTTIAERSRKARGVAGVPKSLDMPVVNIISADYASKANMKVVTGSILGV